MPKTRRSSGSIVIEEAIKRNIPQTLEILLDSYLGEEYFSREVAEPILREAAKKRELFVAKDRNGEVKGYYEKRGYIRVGTIPSLFSSGVDEYLRMKDLGMGRPAPSPGSGSRKG
jgi:hypothetical protein